MNNYIGYIGISMTIVFTMYSQLIIKWQVNNAGELPLDSFGKLKFLLVLLLNPWVISAIISTFCAGVSWMLAMAKLDLSYAYPFLSLVYAFMMIASVVFFNESLNTNKIIGVFFIMVGIIVLTRN